MRNRSNSGVRLDYYQRLVNKTILKHQNPVTGLLPASESNSHAWVRDNVYSITAVWGLAQAYRKTADLDEDRAKAYELEQAVVKCMRGLLRCMVAQVDKLERFKHTQQRGDSLHAKYDSRTGKTVVGDYEWGHLQIDATSLYILMLAQMTASGLQIIFTKDEVDFVQNLIFYIETAYRTPDYGIWERGDKTNHGLPELNSSSIGMAKAALEAINELDLFGSRGGPTSVIHVLPDEAQQCQAILQSMLPRESNSKEIDAALLTVISFPAFAVDDTSKIDETRKLIQQKLEGKYGCCRFLRDGYKTAREDPNRLHYEPWELQVFEKIECHWPLFFAYLILDGLFYGNDKQVEVYRDKLDSILLKSEDGIPMVPEMYTVPRDKVEQEYRNPNSQKRDPIGKVPQMWGESMYILGKLVQEGFLSPGELDPLNRRLVSEPKPDIVVQVVILAEDTDIQAKLAEHDIIVQTITEANPIQVYPARVLTQLYSLLGKNNRLGLTGRPSSEIGLLATSKLYSFQDMILAFIPQFLDQHHFYLPLDAEFLIDILTTDIEYMSRNWRLRGRPLFLFSVMNTMLDMSRNPPNALIGTIKKLQSGYIAGTRVKLGTVSDFLTTSCVTRLSFLNDESHESEVNEMMGDFFCASCPRPRLLSTGKKKGRRLRVKSSVHGIVRRSRSIQVDPEQIPDHHERQARDRESVFIDGTLHASLRRSMERGSHSTVSESEDYSDPVSPESEDDIHPHLHLKGFHQPSAERPMSPVGSPSVRRAFHHPEGMHERISITELVDQLNSSEQLNEQADIIHYLFLKKGIDWETEVGEKSCTIRELLVELYEKAGHWKQWWLVRHTAGMLQKRVEELALAATDLLVRQKQLSVGLPPDRENVITCPLPPEELAKMIFESSGEDHSTASLTQELLIYLAMFIRTEPKLFNEMLRLRVGLIIQVMASELARTLKCSGDEASEQLLNLSPFEMKTLLHHILSGKEFVINSELGDHDEERRLTITSKMKTEETSEFARLSKNSPLKPRGSSIATPAIHIPDTEHPVEEEMVLDRQGQWLRRRRLDGALNRVPVGFYSKVWCVLNLCDGLSIEGHTLPNSLTREMTAGEFKFALRVETVLNYIPQPEYRQLMVEALMVLTLLTENEWKLHLNQFIQVDRLVHEANSIFIRDQNIPSDVVESSKGAAGISLHLYDSAPSGQYGTMSYLCRALAKTLPLPFNTNSELECTVA